VNIIIVGNVLVVMEEWRRGRWRSGFSVTFWFTCNRHDWNV